MGEKTEEYRNFTIPIKKKVTKIDKNGEEITKNISYYYNLFIAQELWHANYQILLIIFLKEFIELDVNSNTMIKSMKHVELNINVATVFLNT